MFKNYYEIRKWLENFIPQTWTRKELGLERISYILKLLGNPQNKFKSIHIAGTSGKGSTAFYIARLLQGSSQKTVKIGLHISPHLVDIRERMQVFGSRNSEFGSRMGSLIPMGEFIKLVNGIRSVVEKIKKEKPDLTPSYFEILVAGTFLYFAQEKVDWAVVEVGLGGRLDATNVLNPQLTVITNVGLDHTDVLGKTQEKIAFEKAGIIKRVKELESQRVKERIGGVPVITGATGKALAIIQKVAKEKNAPLITINTQSSEKALKFVVFSNSNLPIDIFRSTDYSLAFSNKLLALAVVNVLGISPYNKHYSSSEAKRNREVPIKIDSRQARIINHVFNLTFPGRFEEIQKGVILDGAHNADKVRFLIEFVRNSKLETRNSKQIQKSKIQNPKSIILVIAFKKGKDWKKMIDLLVKNLPVNQVIATKFHAVTDMGKHQAVDPKEIARYIKSKWKVKVESQNNSHGAVFEAVNCQLSTVNCLILITGSLYLVGEVRTIWKLPAC